VATSIPAEPRRALGTLPAGRAPWRRAVDPLVVRHGRWLALADGQQDLQDADAAPELREVRHEVPRAAWTAQPHRSGATR
jgi:hypothetical protein